jgi:hypothetical protein
MSHVRISPAPEDIATVRIASSLKFPRFCSDHMAANSL